MEIKEGEMITWEQKPTFTYSVDNFGNSSLIINRKGKIPIQYYLHSFPLMEAEDKAQKFVLEKKLEYEKTLHDFEIFKKHLKTLS